MVVVVVVVVMCLETYPEFPELATENEDSKLYVFPLGDVILLCSELYIHNPVRCISARVYPCAY